MHGLFTIGYLHLSNNIPKYSKRFNLLTNLENKR